VEVEEVAAAAAAAAAELFGHSHFRIHLSRFYVVV
jgi:hypothetical protein